MKAKRNPHDIKEPLPADFYFIVNGRPTNNLLEVLIAKRQRANNGMKKSGDGYGSNSSSLTTDPSLTTTTITTTTTTDPYPALDLPFGKTLRIGVVFVESPSEFWCQLVEEASVLEQLMDFLQLAFDQQKLLPLEAWPPRVRHPVAARFTDDDAWYRAVVTDVLGGDKVQVLFVDFGERNISELIHRRKHMRRTYINSHSHEQMCIHAIMLKHMYIQS